MHAKTTNPTTGLSWYKVWIIIPGTDGTAEDGPGEPVWWNDMQLATSKEAAMRQANDKANEQWEKPNCYAPGVEAPSDKDMGMECPVCTGAAVVTDDEYAAWKREQDAMDDIPFE